MYKTDPSREHIDGDLLGFGVRTEIHLPHGVSFGEAFFDVQPYFPSFVLFLDSSNCLVLKRTGNAEQEYRRIGIARFLRTSRQRAEIPTPTVALDNNSLKELAAGDGYDVPLGPITGDYEHTSITII